MAQGTGVSFGNFIVQVGDGADPEVFSAPCGLKTKGFNQSLAVQELTVPDCADGDAAVYVDRAADTKSAELSGAGVMTTEAFDTYQQWYDSGASKNCRVYPKGAAGGYWQGAFVLSTFNLQVQRAQKADVDLTMQSDGAVVWNAP